MSSLECLITHKISPESLQVAVQKIAERIEKNGEKEHVSRATQLRLLDELSQFDLGRFLLQNQGLNGYWTHYILTYPWYGRKTGLNNQGKAASGLEQFILNQAPAMLATQQRFEVFLQENQKKLMNKAKLACIPCGMMGELLYLDFTGIKEVQLIGVDYDPRVLEDAKALAAQRQLSPFIELIHQDAWQLNIEDTFDLISSNGLSIYEPDDNKVVSLYRQFYRALKPGGSLVTSFLTPPPHFTADHEWLMDQINEVDFIKQRIIFVDILDAKWQCYRTTKTVKNQLESVGFYKIKFIYDKAHIFPTVVAEK